MAYSKEIKEYAVGKYKDNYSVNAIQELLEKELGQIISASNIDGIR